MRLRPTPEEVALWDVLQDRQIGGVKFRRQAILAGRFIADFYAHEFRLAIELDGKAHFRPHDMWRDRILREAGIRTIRFQNTEVNRHILDVRECILEAIQKAVRTTLIPQKTEVFHRPSPQPVETQLVEGARI